MDGHQTAPTGERKGGLRGRVIPLVALPVAILGVTYFLFVEYVLANLSLNTDAVRLALRLGGGVLAVLALVLALACGYLIAERMVRPVRLLVRLIESGELDAVRSAFLHHREWEILELYRRVTALVHQNRAGAQAVEELERMREGIRDLRHALARPGMHGIPAEYRETAAVGPLAEIAGHLEANRTRLLQFFEELRERIGVLRLEVDALGRGVGLIEPEVGTAEVPTPASTSLRDSGGTRLESLAARGRGGNGAGVPRAQNLDHARQTLASLRRFGTVLVLDSSRASGNAGARAAELLSNFQTSINELDRELEETTRWIVSRPQVRMDVATETAFAQLLESVGTLERRLAEVDLR